MRQIDKIDVTKYGTIEVREIVTYEENGEQKQIFHRMVLEPGQDISGLQQELQDVCASVWTNEVVSKYNEKMQQQRNSQG